MKSSLLVLVGLLFVAGCSSDKKAEIEFRYAPASRGELVRSISATGQVVALTTVDVKSKAGGKVVKLVVNEGDYVKQGQLIATIDPSDTQAIYSQSSADLESAEARQIQAQKSYELQVAQSKTEVANARAALAAAQVRLERARIENQRQPDLTRANVQGAQAQYDSALAAQEKLLKVTIPQLRREAKSNLSQAKASLESANSDMRRQKELFNEGYVARSVMEKSRSTAEAAQTSYDIALQRQATIEDEIRAQTRSVDTALRQALANLNQSKANSSEVAVSRTNLAEAQNAVEQAKIALQKALDNRIQNQVRNSDIIQAKASSVRNKVSLDNAKVQLDSTTVVAPRDGVVTLKYLEEGTIIPPGTSTFAQGTSLVQLSDVTQLFIECAVDEADVSNVKLGQPVRITADAFRGTKLDGVVNRISPAAKTDNNVTAVKVRVQVKSGSKVRLLPGMNATCEFITMSKKDILLIPQQALREDGTVRVKTSNPLKPEIRKVEIGETGNEGIEVKSGLKEGEEVVTAEIDLAAMRETQKRMQEAQEGGGLAGGGPSGGRKTPAKPKTTAGGGAKGGR